VRKVVSSTCVIALLLVAAGLCRAQETQTKPLVTVSFSGYDNLMTDAGYVGKLLGKPDMVKGMEGMLEAMTQGKGLAGLDKSRPWGVVASTDGEAFPVTGFLPVTDLKELMGVLAGLDVQAKEGEDGVWKISLPGPSVFIKQKGEWAFVGQSAEALANVPEDPTTALGGLDEKYDLAAKASVKNIPPVFRQMALAQIQLGMNIEQMPGEPDEQFAARKKLAEQAVKPFTTMLDEWAEILVGINVDESTQAATLDVEVTAVEGTNTAKQFAQMADAKSSFTGVNLPDAAVVANWAGALTDDDVAQLKTYLETFRENTAKELKKQNLSEEQLKLAGKIITDLLDVVEKSIEMKKSDGGFALVLDPKAVTAVGGTVIADGAKLESTLKLLVAEMKKDAPELGEMLKLDAETYEGIRFHVLNVPLADPKLEAMVGKTAEVVVGIGDDKLYLAAGRDATATLKKVMDDSKAADDDMPPVKVTIVATPIAKFVAEVAEELQVKMMAQMVAGTLQAGGGMDRVVITSEPIPNGARTRIVIEEGLLKMILAAAQMFGAGGPPTGPGGGAAPTPF